MSTNHNDSDRAVRAAAEWGSQDFSKTTPPSAAEQQRLLAGLPKGDADAPVMASRSLRMSPDMEKRIKAAAEAEGVTASEWMRQAIERAIASTDPDQISRDAAIEAAIKALRRVPHAV